MRLRLMLLLCGVVALAVGVSTANAGGGNSDAAHACQKGGWQNLVRSDGTSFANQGECVSYAAQGGTLKPKPTCTAGSEDFSGDAEFSTPTTFSGGTIDSAFGSDGGILIQGSSVFGGFANGAHVVYSGDDLNSFHLTFTNSVGSVSLVAQSALLGESTTETLTAYDASNTAVGSNQATDPNNSVNTITVTSGSNNIKSFTIATDAASFGVEFTNIVWTCN